MTQETQTKRGKKPATGVKRLKRAARVFTVLSRRITTKAGGKAVWGSRYREWNEHEDNARNIRDAITDAIEVLAGEHIGTIVYVTQKGSRKVTPIWEAKWGHDGLPYMAWKGAFPVADYWRRRTGIE